jgi:hypothetical protein
MHELELGTGVLHVRFIADILIYAPLDNGGFFSSRLALHRAFAMRSKSAARSSPVGFISLTCWVSAKNLMQSLRTVRKC